MTTTDLSPELRDLLDRLVRQQGHPDPARPLTGDERWLLLVSLERALVDPFEVVRCACGVSGAADKSKGIVA